MAEIQEKMNVIACISQQRSVFDLIVCLGLDQHKLTRLVHHKQVTQGTYANAINPSHDLNVCNLSLVNFVVHFIARLMAYYHLPNKLNRLQSLLFTTKV